MTIASNLLDGKAAAAQVYRGVQSKVQALSAKGVTPGLATVLVGDDPASAVYVGQKIKACERNGVKSIHVPLKADITQMQLSSTVQKLNTDAHVHGILVQLPLPKHLNAEEVLLALNPAKDADGLHPSNQGRWAQLKSWRDVLASGLPLPCTPWGVMELLAQNKIDPAGKHAVVVGRSTLVGKPLALMLLAADATVTLCHSRTKDLAAVCRQADILVAALGAAKFVKGDWVKPGAVVVDVGISRTAAGLVGDVDFEAARGHAQAITPVPGGVGAMTVAMLLWNTVRLAEGAGR